MSQPTEPDDHPLLPEDDESELRYDERTTDEADRDESDPEEQNT